MALTQQEKKYAEELWMAGPPMVVNRNCGVCYNAYGREARELDSSGVPMVALICPRCGHAAIFDKAIFLQGMTAKGSP